MCAGITFPFLHPTFPKTVLIPVDAGPGIPSDLTDYGWLPFDAGETTNRSFARKFIAAQPSAAETQAGFPSLTRDLASTVMGLNHPKLLLEANTSNPRPLLANSTNFGPLGLCLESERLPRAMMLVTTTLAVFLSGLIAVVVDGGTDKSYL